MSTDAWIEEHWIGEAVLPRLRRAPKLPALPVPHAPACFRGNAALAAHAQNRDSARYSGDGLSASQDGRNVVDQQARKLTQPSNTLGADFCVEALEEALVRYGHPEIFNTDQGSQFTSDDFTGTLKDHGIMISMDGKGRCMDNIFVERLWRSLKYEEVYLNAYASVAEAKAGIGAWLDFYNEERQHQSLGYRTPREIYDEGLWICGRSALPTGSASPASRASSTSGEMLAFAHIPTGTAANKGFDIDEVNSRLLEPAVALTATGADIETGRVTP